jgi:hypothetical protein
LLESIYPCFGSGYRHFCAKVPRENPLNYKKYLRVLGP